MARNLSRHPGIWTPPLKELHYFDQRIKEPSFGALVAKVFGKQYTDDWHHSWFWPLQIQKRLQRHRKKFDPQAALWDFRFFVRSPSDRWYASLFGPGQGKTTGEITPDYSILEEETIAHIYELMPNTKIIFLMRSPIEQVYSSAVMGLDLMGQRAEEASDEEFFELLKDDIGKPHARHLQNLERWRRFYPDNQIFVGFLEDIHFYPARLLRRLYTFLGVDSSYARQAMRHKIHTRFQERIPTRLATHLAHVYHEDLQYLDARFGGYTSFWLYCAEKLANDAPAEDSIPYPLWESHLWEEWVDRSCLASRANSREAEFQSGSLETILQ